MLELSARATGNAVLRAIDKGFLKRQAVRMIEIVFLLPQNACCVLLRFSSNGRPSCLTRTNGKKGQNAKPMPNSGHVANT